MSASTYPVPAGAAEGCLPVELTARLNDPQTVAQLDALLDNLELVNLVVGSLGELLAHSETIFDSVLDSARDAGATVKAARLPDGEPLDVKATAEATAQLLTALPKVTPALLRGIESGAIDELTAPGLAQILELVSGGAQAALTDADQVKAGSALALLRALKDPDVARGLSFFLTVVRNIGRALPTVKPTDGDR